MQSVSSRIWTRIAESISYDDNHYTTDEKFIGWKVRTMISYLILKTFFSYKIKALQHRWKECVDLKETILKKTH